MLEMSRVLVLGVSIPLSWAVAIFIGAITIGFLQIGWDLYQKNNTPLKIKAAIAGLAWLVVLIFGFKQNGDVYYYGEWYDAGSIFSPSTYYSYAGSAQELNELVSQARQDSLNTVLTAVVVFAFVVLILWQEDDFKDSIVKFRREVREASKRQKG